VSGRSDHTKNSGDWSDRKPRWSDHPVCSGSTHVTCNPNAYDHNCTTHGSGALPASPSDSTEFSLLPVSARDFGYAQRRALDSTHATCYANVYDHSRTTNGFRGLPVSPSGYTRATITTSTLAVATGEGCTGGISGQSSSDDHAGEVVLLAFSRQTYPVIHFGVNSVTGAFLHPHHPRRSELTRCHGRRVCCLDR
jgi:hypothetical protein